MVTVRAESIQILYQCGGRQDIPGSAVWMGRRDKGGALFGGIAHSPWKKTGNFYGGRVCMRQGKLTDTVAEPCISQFADQQQTALAHRGLTSLPRHRRVTCMYRALLLASLASPSASLLVRACHSLQPGLM
jgi:hypothetical protein